jgi:predicted permease
LTRHRRFRDGYRCLPSDKKVKAMFDWFKVLAARLHGLLARRKLDEDFQQELEAHLEMLTEENICRGLPPQEARRGARLRLGGMTQLHEVHRELWGLPWLETLVQDVRYGLRQLRRNPGFTAVAVITLALGIGADTAIFSVIEAVLLRPLPYKDPGRLALLTDPQDHKDGAFLYKDLEAWRVENRSFRDLAVYYRDSGYSRVTLTAGDEPESVQGAFVSANLFRSMGVAPLLGRVFTPEEEARGERVVLLSYGLWLRRFGGSEDVTGKTLQINGINSVIIGVMPESFQFPDLDQQFWAPITTNPYWNDSAVTTNIDPRHTGYFYERWQAIGRLKPGVSSKQAQAEMTAVFTRTQRADPDKNRGTGIDVVPLRINLSGNTRRALTVLFGAVFFVLLIACCNVANLVLERGAGRDREMAVRTALGAERRRLIRQLLTENAVMAIFSGILGLFLASVGVRALVALGPPDIPRLNEAGLDIGVLAFTLGISLFAAVLFGLAPALKMWQNGPNESLKSGCRAASGSVDLRRTRGVLVIAELALAVILLTGAGLLVRSFLATEAVNPGFRPEHVLTMQVTWPTGTSDVIRSGLYKRVLENVRSLPGVQAAGGISDLFEMGPPMILGLRSIEGRAPEPREKWTPLIWKSVSGECFRALGTPLLRGRYFADEDGPNSPLVAIIDQATARRYWPGEDPIGEHFKGQDPRGRNDDWLTVIGVVGNMRRSGLDRRPTPHIFEWYRQSEDAPAYLVVRTVGDRRALAASLRSAVRSVSKTAILSPVTTLDEQLSDQLSVRRFQTWLLGLFSLLALVLASVGIYGVLHYSVGRRTHEIGIRMALGAQKHDVVRLVLTGGISLTAIGVGIEIGGALALTRFLSSLLYGVKPTDPLTFIAVCLILIAVALLACYIPARRATKVDPMVALRYE